MLPLARLEGEQISGAIYVYLLISGTLNIDVNRIAEYQKKTPDDLIFLTEE